MSTQKHPNIVKLLARRSGAGVSIKAVDDRGLEHSFAAAEELTLEDGALIIVHRGDVHRFSIALPVEA